MTGFADANSMKIGYQYGQILKTKISGKSLIS